MHVLFDAIRFHNVRLVVRRMFTKTCTFVQQCGSRLYDQAYAGNRIACFARQSYLQRLDLPWHGNCWTIRPDAQHSDTDEHLSADTPKDTTSARISLDITFMHDARYSMQQQTFFVYYSWCHLGRTTNKAQGVFRFRFEWGIDIIGMCDRKAQGHVPTYTYKSLCICRDMTLTYRTGSHSFESYSKFYRCTG